LSLFADELILYREETQKISANLLKLIDSVKLPDTKSTNKNQLFLYTDNVLSVKEKDFKNSICQRIFKNEIFRDKFK
jgi:hypothetical protein